MGGERVRAIKRTTIGGRGELLLLRAEVEDVPVEGASVEDAEGASVEDIEGPKAAVAEL